MHDKNEFRFQLDTPEPIKLNAHEYYLQGWCIPGGGASESPQILVMVDGVEYPVLTGRKRPDVAAFFNNSSFVDCGFVAWFETRTSNPMVRLIARTTAGQVVLAEARIGHAPTLRAQTKSNLCGLSTYQEWLDAREKALFWPTDEVSERIAMLTNLPLISIILPTLNTERCFLELCIRSVLRQHYTHWQLRLVYDHSTDDRVIEYLQSLEAEDSRIRLVHCQHCGGRAAALNTALEAAKGDFVVLLFPLDELHRFALLEVVRLLNQEEGAVLIYSDEDKIDDFGKRGQPVFKSGFDLDMLLSFDYISNLVAVRRSLLLELKGFRPEFEGAEVWDLLIRIVEATEPSAVHHIEKPLYHRRMLGSIAAPNLDADSQLRNLWGRVVAEHIERTGKRASAEPGLFNSTRVKYFRPEEARIAIVLRAEDGMFRATGWDTSVDWSHVRLYELVNCVLYPLGSDGSRDELSSAFSESEAGAAYSFSEDPRSQPLRSLSEMAEEVFIFINRPLDSVSHGFLDELVAQAMREECGLVTGISLDLQGFAIHTGLLRGSNGALIDPFEGILFPRHGNTGEVVAVRQVEGITEEFFAVKRDHLAAVGGLGSVWSGHMGRLARRLVKNAHEKALKVLVTPYAVATFDLASRRPPMDPVRSSRPLGVTINSNLLEFDFGSSLLEPITPTSPLNPWRPANGEGACCKEWPGNKSKRFRACRDLKARGADSGS